MFHPIGYEKRGNRTHRRNVCVQHSLLSLKRPTKFWKVEMSIPGRRMVCAKPWINGRECKVVGIASYPMQLSSWLWVCEEAVKAKTRELCSLTKVGHPDFPDTRLVLYSVSLVEPVRSPKQANWVRCLLQKDLSGDDVEEAEAQRPLKSLFQDQAGADGNFNYSSACVLSFELPCVPTKPLSPQGSALSLLLGLPPQPRVPFPELLTSPRRLSRNIGSLYFMNPGTNYCIFLQIKPQMLVEL